MAAAVTSAALIGFAWKVRGVVGAVAVVQSLIEGRPAADIVAGAFVAATYLAPRAIRARARRARHRRASSERSRGSVAR